MSVKLDIDDSSSVIIEVKEETMFKKKESPSQKIDVTDCFAQKVVGSIAPKGIGNIDKEELHSYDDNFRLDRFVSAQDRNDTYNRAMEEIRAGSKTSHWMWFVFPQLRGLGHSEMSIEFGISSLEEAKAYLSHPVLGERLREAVLAMLSHEGHKTPQEILGDIDARKFRSCLTLFDLVCPNDMFEAALISMYGGSKCHRTLDVLS